MYKHQDFEYQPQHPHLKNYNNCPACFHQDDRFQHSAACGFLDRKECKQADEIWKKIMAKSDEDRAAFVDTVKEAIENEKIKDGKKLIESLKKGAGKELAALLDKLKDKYHLMDFGDSGLYQWNDRDGKKSMWDYFSWLKQVIYYSIDPKGRFAGKRGPVPTLKDIGSAKTVGHV